MVFLISGQGYLLSRAGVKSNRKLILVLIQERTLLLVSGRIESSAFSLSLGSCSFSLAFSLVLLPSFFLSTLLVLAFLPSFFPSLSCNTFIGQMLSEQIPRSAVAVRICMFVRSRKNLHTCKLPLAGSRSPLVKYARGSHIGFCSTKYTTERVDEKNNKHSWARVSSKCKKREVCGTFLAFCVSMS